MHPARAALVVATGLLSALALHPSAEPLPVGPAIQPGVRIAVVDLEGDPVTQEGMAIGGCTGGFVFDGVKDDTGKTYLGTAAHCVRHVGEAVSLLETGEEFGDVAYLGDPEVYDVALIAIRKEFLPRVKAGMRGHEDVPKRVASPGRTKAGDAVLVNDLVVVPKDPGSLVRDDARNYVVDAPIIPFDSGGPLVHVRSGGALGVVSLGNDCAAGPFECATYSGPTVHGALGEYARHGFTLRLRTVR
jgi:hypothetical protein